MFKYDNGFVVNERGQVMDVSGNKDAENQNIHMWKKHGGKNQQWDIVYVEDMKAEPVKGELSPDFGLYVERPFHIVSEMPSHRYLDIISNNLVVKTPNGFDTQIFWFDQKTRTIKS